MSFSSYLKKFQILLEEKLKFYFILFILCIARSKNSTWFCRGRMGDNGQLVLLSHPKNEWIELTFYSERFKWIFYSSILLL